MAVNWDTMADYFEDLSELESSIKVMDESFIFKKIQCHYFPH